MSRDESTSRSTAAAGTARVAAVQWQFTAVESVDALVRRIEAWVRTAADYRPDLIVFPELFTLSLLGLFPRHSGPAALLRVAGLSEQVLSAMADMAVEHDVHIAAGSMPMEEDGGVGNVATLIDPGGRRSNQRKLHITPDEVTLWGIRGGDGLKVFDTKAGRVAILICYDAEFPELARLLVERDVDILLVPSWTTLRSGYLRVRYCCQARAIENECYVVLTGNCGAVPEIEGLEMQYAQAAVFSPSDIGFPPDAVVAQAQPNLETVMVAELNLDRLRRLREEGAVRNRRDRRTDLYGVQWHGKKHDEKG